MYKWSVISKWLWLIVVMMLVIAAGVQVVHLSSGPTSRPLQVGNRLTPFPAKISEFPVEIDFAAIADCTFVIFSSPDCGFCQNSAPRWREEFGRDSGRRTLLLSLADIHNSEQFMIQHSLEIPMLTASPLDMVQRLHISGVPTIVLLKNHGQVVGIGHYDYDLAVIEEEAGCAV